MFLTLAPGDTGRGANTGWWCGLSNLFWWVDREKGVSGMLGECRHYDNLPIRPAY